MIYAKHLDMSFKFIFYPNNKDRKNNVDIQFLFDKINLCHLSMSINKRDRSCSARNIRGLEGGPPNIKMN